MALTATLEFGDNNIGRYPKRYLVSDYHLVFDRSFNTFAPEATARCERLEVVVVAPGRNDLSLFEWFSTQGAQDGRIVIGNDSDSGKTDDDTQIIHFEDGRCFALSESYDIDNQRRRLLKLAIIAEQLDIDGINYNVK